MTKFALTGHTSGIGHRLFEILGEDVIGFSKSSGFNVNVPADRKKIIELSKHCDVFINNACPLGFGQTALFIELINEWKDDATKTIINVGSDIANTDIILDRNRFFNLHYQAQKISLKEMSLRLPSVVKCTILYKTFGYVGTERIKSLLSDKFPNAPYISVDDACDIILSDYRKSR
jgi:hypothetical protein